jgi:hypothetical protein
MQATFMSSRMRSGKKGMNGSLSIPSAVRVSHQRMEVNMGRKVSKDIVTPTLEFNESEIKI